MQKLFRIDPKMQVQAYKTYGVRQRPDIQVKAACEDVGCLAYHHGWETAVDESLDCGQDDRPDYCRWILSDLKSLCGRCTAQYLRHYSGRTFKEQKRGDGMTVFTFDSKQRCFAEHLTQPQIHLVRAGDWRGNLGLIRRHQNGSDWQEDWAEHQEQIKEQVERG